MVSIQSVCHLTEIYNPFQTPSPFQDQPHILGIPPPFMIARLPRKIHVNNPNRKLNLIALASPLTRLSWRQLTPKLTKWLPKKPSKLLKVGKFVKSHPQIWHEIRVLSRFKLFIRAEKAHFKVNKSWGCMYYIIEGHFLRIEVRNLCTRSLGFLSAIDFLKRCNDPLNQL